MTEEQPYINILDKEIPYRDERRGISVLSFYEKNPRVLSKLMRANKLNGTADEKQLAIEEGMRTEVSVKYLRKTIFDHGGISEPLIIQENGEVLEGNSRLAALRILYKENQEEKYFTAPCRVVKFEENEIDAFLHQQHVDGKVPWSAYDKAYSAYHRVKIDGVLVHEYAARTSDSEREINKQIETIDLMQLEGAGDKTERFSYYDQITRSTKLKHAFDDNSDLKRYLLDQLQEDKIPFTAQDLRDNVPVIAKKRKVLTNWVKGKVDFEEAVQLSKVSHPKQQISKAINNLQEVNRDEVDKLDSSERAALKIKFKNCVREVKRIENILKRNNNE